MKEVYVGRTMGPGSVQSKWANPYRIDSARDRTRVIDMYKKLVRSNPGKYVVEELIGNVLLCHFRKDEDCHADFLCTLANKAHNDIDDGLAKESDMCEAMADLVDEVMLQHIDNAGEVKTIKAAIFANHRSRF